MIITQRAHIYSFHTSKFNFGEIFFLIFLSIQPLLTLKMEAVGFKKRTNMGFRAHYNFVADPEVAEYSVMVRRIPCFCPGCLQRFKKYVSERYANHCNDCKYWQIYQGWNDWRKVNF